MLSIIIGVGMIFIGFIQSKFEERWRVSVRPILMGIGGVGIIMYGVYFINIDKTGWSLLIPLLLCVIGLTTVRIGK